MKNKKIIIGSIIGIVVIVAVALCVMLFGNDSKKDDLQKKIDNGEPIEIIVKDNNFEMQGEDTDITWTQLADLTSYAQFRTAFENALGITKDGSLKVGSIYVTTDGKQTNNSTLYNAFMNKAFTQKWNDENIQSQLQDGISTTYADLEESDYTAAIINAYFNLLDDNQPNYFNGGASLSRAQAMTILMRAVTPVEDLKVNESFNSLVGESEYTAYASYMNDFAYINSADKSLSEQNFNGAMTRAEFIYMLMNYTFGKDNVSKYDISKVKLNDCKNAGNIAKAKKFSGKNYCNSYVLNEMVKNPDSGATDEIYQAIAMAKDLGIIGAETRWEESISLTEGIDILISTFEAYTNINGSKTEQETGNVADNSDKAKELYSSNKNGWVCDEATFISKYNGYVAQGLTEEQIKHQLTVEFSVDYNEQPTTEKPTEQATEQATEKPMTLQERYRSFPTGWTQFGNSEIFGKIWYYVTSDRTVYRVYEENKSLFDTNNIKKSVEQGYGKEVYRELPEETEKQTTSKPQQTTEKPTEKPQQQTTQQTTSSSSGNNQEEETTEFNPEDYGLFDPTKGDVGPSGGYDPNKQ